MKHTLLLLVVASASALAWAQSSPPSGTQPYQPVVPPPSVTNYGGYPGYSTGGGTPAGSALNGMANVISAKGDYNLATSAAAVNMTQAERNEIQNRQLWTNAYFDMRATNRAARAAERGPNPTMAQLVRIAQEGVPKQISPSQLDPISGAITWPTLLKTERYAAGRTELEQLLTKRATSGDLDFSDQSKVRQTIDTMFAELKGQIRDVPTADYLASKNFLQSLAYTVVKAQLN